MADGPGPNWSVEQLKLRIGVQDLTTRLMRLELEIAEAKGRIENAKNNIKATRKAIAESEERLSVLVKEHGDLTEGVKVDG